jgi:hypothetical protein
VYELIFCRGLILNIVFHSVNDCVGGLVTVVCQQSGLLGGRVDQIPWESRSPRGNSMVEVTYKKSLVEVKV